MGLLKATIAALIGYLVFVGFLLLGCSSKSSVGGTETGNTQASIRVVGYQSSQLAAFDLQALTVGGLGVNTARIVLDRLRFRPFSVCQSEKEDEGSKDFQFDGPFIVDLLSPEALSGLEGVEIPTGRYCRIELVLKKIESPGVMFNRSVLIEGTRADGTPFQMTTEVDEEFELENETTGFLIEASSAIKIFFIAFDLNQWFSGLNGLLDPSIKISTGSNGGPIILINDDQNEEIQERIEDNIKFSADLFKDSDDNEDLDPDEQENSLAAGTTMP